MYINILNYEALDLCCHLLLRFVTTIQQLILHNFLYRVPQKNIYILQNNTGRVRNILYIIYTSQK